MNIVSPHRISQAILDRNAHVFTNGNFKTLTLSLSRYAISWFHFRAIFNRYGDMTFSYIDAATAANSVFHNPTTAIRIIVEELKRKYVELCRLNQKNDGYCYGTSKRPKTKCILCVAKTMWWLCNFSFTMFLTSHDCSLFSFRIQITKWMWMCISSCAIDVYWMSQRRMPFNWESYSQMHRFWHWEI